MNKLFMLLVLLLCVPVVSAIPSLYVTVELYENGSAEIVDVFQEEGNPMISYGDLDYGIRIGKGETYVYNESFPVSFLIFSDPPKEVGRIRDMIVIPYTGNTGQVELSYKGKTLSSFNLSRLCRQNNLCSVDENSFTCPEDCKFDQLTERDEEGMDQFSRDYMIFWVIMTLFMFIVVALILHEMPKTKKRRS